MAIRPRGRPKKYSEYEELLSSLPRPMTKRPRYVSGIGIFRGTTGDTVWIKIRLPHGAIHNGKRHNPGSSLEVKLGDLSSWTWEELETERQAMQRKADRGEELEDAPTILFSEWASDWLKRAKVRLRGYGTVKIHVNSHFNPYFGNKVLSSITTSDINHWISERRSNAMPSTVKREIGTLGSIFNDAKRSGKIGINPCREADTIRGVVGRQRFLTHEEITKLIIAAEEIEEWLPDFILWCLHSGMRKGEIRALLWSDIQQIGDGPMIVNVRTSKSDQPRFVHCTETMIEILDRQDSRKIEEDDRVFPISAMTLRRRWEAARKQADLEDVTIHDLRRTHSTYAAAAGVDLNTLANRIGHSDLSMLQKHYAAIVGSAAAEAADTIQEVFKKLSEIDGD